MEQSFSKLYPLALVALLSACGGGGSGGSSTPTPQELYSGPSQAVTLTSGNGDEVASAVYSSNSLDLAGALGQGVSPKPSEESGDLVSKLRSIADAALETASQNGSQLVGTSHSLCSTGSASVSGQFSVPPADGDFMSVAFNNCAQIGGEVIDGSLTITFHVSGIASNPGFSELDHSDSWGLGFTFSADEFTESSGGSIDIKMHGAMTLMMSYDQPSTDFTSAITGNAMYLKFGSEDILFTNFDLTEVVTESNSTTSVNIDFTLASNHPDLMGSVTVETLVGNEFVNPGGAFANPNSGVMEITGQGGAKVRMSANPDGLNVTIEYDLDADGTYGNNLDPGASVVPWASIDV